MKKKVQPSQLQIKAINRAIKIVGGKAALAKAVGVSAASVSHWSKGKNAVTPSNARKIETLTNKSVLASELAYSLIKEKAFEEDGGLGAYK